MVHKSVVGVMPNTKIAIAARKGCMLHQEEENAALERVVSESHVDDYGNIKCVPSART